MTSLEGDEKASNNMSCAASEIYEKVCHEIEHDIDDSDEIQVIRIRTKKREYILAPENVVEVNNKKQVYLLFVEQILPSIPTQSKASDEVDQSDKPKLETDKSQGF